MIDFFKLVQNENMKIYRRIRTWIMLGFVILLPVLAAAVLQAGAGEASPSNWFFSWILSVMLSYLIAIFTAVAAAESVAGEFTRGTVKLLLIRPWSRSSILLSKFVSVLLFGLLLTVVNFIMTLLMGMLFFGVDAAGSELPNLGDRSPLGYVALTHLYNFISLVVTASFAFMLSSAFRSSGLAIGLSVFIQLAGNIGIVDLLLGAIDKPWVKFVLFPHLRLVDYLAGGEGPLPQYDTTLGFSLAVLAGYFIVFNIVSWAVFTRRDVSA